MKKLFTITLFLFKIHLVLFAQNYDSDGWSINKPNDDSRIIYVSASGDDLTAEVYDKNSSKVGSDPFLPTENIKPFKTIIEAKKRLRVGFADWILFKKGDVFENQVFGHMNFEVERTRIFIGSYGNHVERPKILVGNKTFIFINGYQSSSLTIIGLNIEAHKRSNIDKVFGIKAEGLRCLYLKVEDCHFDKFSTHIYIKNHSGIVEYEERWIPTNISRVIIRRNIFTNAFHKDGTFGLNISKINWELNIEQNYFENNGWEDFSSKKFISNLLTGSIGVGIECQRVFIEKNIITKSNGAGIYTFSGSFINDNLFFENYSHLNIFVHKEGPQGQQFYEDREQYSTCVNNVFLDLLIQDSTNCEHLITFGFLPSKIYFYKNLVLKTKNYNIVPSSLFLYNIPSISQTISQSIFYEYGSTANKNNYRNPAIFAKGQNSVDIYNSDIQVFNKNVSCFISGFSFKSTINNYYNINDTNKWFFLEYLEKYKLDSTSNYEAVSYPDPYRTIETFKSQLGLFGEIETLFKMKSRYKKNMFDSFLTAEYINNYFRNGFNLKPITNFGLKLENKLTKNGISVYPNPTSLNHINIDIKHNSPFQIFDFSGKMVLEGYLNEDYNRVDVNSLSHGIYFIRVDNQFVKLIINKDN